MLQKDHLFLASDDVQAKFVDIEDITFDITKDTWICYCSDGRDLNSDVVKKITQIEKETSDEKLILIVDMGALTLHAQIHRVSQDDMDDCLKEGDVPRGQLDYSVSVQANISFVDERADLISDDQFIQLLDLLFKIVLRQNRESCRKRPQIESLDAVPDGWLPRIYGPFEVELCEIMSEGWMYNSVADVLAFHSSIVAWCRDELTDVCRWVIPLFLNRYMVGRVRSSL